MPVIGSTALFLQCDYERGTKDGDILEIEEIREGKDLIELAGKGSAFAAQNRIYLEIVTRGLPFPGKTGSGFKSISGLLKEAGEVTSPHLLIGFK